jgi:hypothetical protein
MAPPCAGVQLSVRSEILVVIMSYIAIMGKAVTRTRQTKEGKRDDNEDTGSVEAYSDSEGMKVG